MSYVDALASAQTSSRTGLVVLQESKMTNISKNPLAATNPLAASSPLAATNSLAATNPLAATKPATKQDDTNQKKINLACLMFRF